MKYCPFCMEEIQTNSSECPHCRKKMTPEIPLHHLMPGSNLHGKYVVGAALGEGGFGITYLGMDTILQVKVAIKEYFPSGYSSRNHISSNEVTLSGQRDSIDIDKEMQRFLEEARLLARMSDEQGIVNVRDYFEENGTAYIIMEYVSGITLSSYIKKRGVIPANVIFKAIDPVLKSLDKMHQDGLIHRDISPDNIVLQKNGSLKLLDFGAARSITPEKSMSVILKPGYSPEEQYRSKGTQGPWTDVYSVCATIYKCITGKRPDEALERMVNDTLKAPSEMGIIISPKQEEALMKGLAVLSKNRVQSILELRELLYSSDEPKVVPRNDSPDDDKTVREPVKPQKKQVNSQAVPKEPKPQDRAPVYKASSHQPKKKKKTKKSPLPLFLFVVLLVVSLVSGWIFFIKQESGRNSTESDNISGYTNILARGQLQSPQKDITSVISLTFLDSTEHAPSDSWDLSEKHNGTVKGWTTVRTDGMKDLWIAADGGVYAPEKCGGLFSYLVNLQSVNFNHSFHTDNITDASEMFTHCDALMEIDLTEWNTSKMTNISRMFEDCKQLKKVDASGWDTSCITQMEAMFSGCDNLVEFTTKGWNTEAAQNMSHMFGECKSLAYFDISEWDLRNVVTMASMFDSCTSLQSISFPQFNSPSLTDMSFIFALCTSLKDITLSGNINSSGLNMNYAFDYCTQLERVEMGSLHVSRVVSMDALFNGCKCITALDLSGLDTSAVISMSKLFDSCSTLNVVTFGQWDTSKVQDMSSMFANCSALTNLDLSKWNTHHVQNMSKMFYACKNLKTLNLDGWDLKSVAVTDNMFHDCPYLTPDRESENEKPTTSTDSPDAGPMSAEKADVPASALTVDEMYSSLGSVERAARKNRYTFSSESSDEVILQMDIDHDGKDDVLYRTVSGYDGSYEIRFANGSVFTIPIKDNWLYRNYFFFDDLDGSGKIDFVIQNVTSGTGGKAIVDYAIFLDANTSGANYLQYSIPQVTITIEDIGNDQILVASPDYSFSEVQAFGRSRKEADFDYFYGIGEDKAVNGVFSTYHYRDIITDSGTVLVYCDFGRKVHADQSVQLVGMQLRFSKAKNEFEVVKIGSDLIRTHWLSPELEWD